eukprot:7372953-Alexandrium_andersonii.AAC.1
MSLYTPKDTGKPSVLGRLAPTRVAHAEQSESEMCTHLVHEHMRAAQCSTLAPSAPSTRTEGHERAT